MSTQLNVNLAPVQASPIDVLEETLNSAQQAAPVPLVRGQQKVALYWCSEIYNLKAKPSSSSQTGKK